MRKIVLISIVVLVCCVSSLPQKMTEPKLLGNLLAGEDPSEFLLHRVMETSQYYLEDNPDGKLIMRICSSDDFSTAFVKSVFSPLSASNYNVLIGQIIVPYEKIFIAKSAKCVYGKDIVFTQHWFVPGKSTLEFDEVYPVNNIAYKGFAVNDYDFENNKYKRTSIQEKEFESIIIKFVNELKNNSKAEGFIVHNSKNKIMNRNIGKVKTLLGKENINLERVKTIIKVRLGFDKNQKLISIEDEKRYFPELEVLAVEK